jgi:hypothetical protein
MARSLHDDLIQDLEALHDDHDSADMEFMTGSRAGGKLERIRAHRLIVLFRCRRYWNKKQQWLTANLPIVTVRLEWTDADRARRVVRYLYTGQVDCGTSVESVIQTIVAALEFGLPELKAHCLENLANAITADTVCTALMMAHSSLGNITDKSNAVQEVEECCMEFIESNTCAVFTSKGFLKLPKGTLLTIIQSTKLTASEEDVWRGVLAWGQANAGIQRSVQEWTDTDRTKMKLILNGVLEHVRLMEISSEVFAQEVEPTELLSMEMTLARYRHAAVYGKGQLSERQSRSHDDRQGALIGSELLGERTDFQTQINEWCGTPSREWVLLYRASRDGYEARKFHAACDEKGATLVIVKV